MTIREKVRKFVLSEKQSKNMISLYERWRDERGYEDFNDYIKIVEQWSGLKIEKMTKIPFAFFVRSEEEGLIYKVVLKLTRDSYQLAATTRRID